MPCSECEKIREQYPGALCGPCAGIVPLYFAEIERLEAKLAKVVKALGEIRGRSLAAKTHEVGPLEAKGRLTRILELACAALAAAKEE